MDHPYYSIVTFGSPTIGRRRSYYRSLHSAQRDALSLAGGSCTSIRIVRCETAKQAREADISDEYPVEQVVR